MIGTGDGDDEPGRRASAAAGRSSATRAGAPGSSTPSSSAATGSLEPARREDAFSEEPGELWRAVLTRKGGSYALVARMPTDPSVN